MGKIIIGTLLILWGLSALLGFDLFRFFFAIVIILIGVRIISGRRHWNYANEVSTVSEDYINEVAVFSPLNKAVKSENFKGGKVTLVFAGGEIDLSQAKTSAKEIDLNIVTVFAGAKLVVPKNWKVNTQGTAIFGGYDSKVTPGEGHVTLNLKGSAVFGGIEIVNQ